MMKNINHISDSYLCSNCGACNAICAKEAIRFDVSNMGRLYAKVDEKKCVACGLCQKVCPSIDYHNLHSKYSDIFLGDIKGVYVGRSFNEVIFQNAQSGGVCTGLLSYMFDAKLIDCAVVCRSLFGEKPKVEPYIATSKSDLMQSQKSNYTPVDILSILKYVQGFKSVAIVGLPCHIMGARELQLVSRKYGNIKYTLGLICDRTLCAGVMDVFSLHLQSILKSSPIHFKIDWRCKLLGKIFNYKSAPLVVRLEDGRGLEFPRNMRFALKDMFTSPRCRVCPDKLNVHADLVLGDPWNMSGVDWEKGDSVIIVRSELGQLLLQDAVKANYIGISSRDKEEVIVGQQIELRRKKYSIFANALTKILGENGSWLLHIKFLKTRRREKKEALNSVQKFLERENIHNKELIYSEALNVINEYNKKSNIFIRVFNRIKMYI